MKGVSNKRGVSAIVATVLIILITVAAVTIIWAAIIPMIDERLTLSNDCLDAVKQISIVPAGSTCYHSESNSLNVQIKRGSDATNISDIMISSSDSDGNSFTDLTGSVPGLNGVIPFFIPFSGNGLPSSVSVAPLITFGNTIKTCDISSTLTDIPNCRSNIGLFSWWKFDESVGLTASDSEGNHDGALMESTSWTSGNKCKSGNCLNFGGSGYVTVPSFDLSGNSMSITAWIYADSFNSPNNYARIVSKATSTSPDAHYFMVSASAYGQGTELRSRFKTRGSDGNTNTKTHKGGDLPTGTLTHIAVVYNGTNISHYVDGTPQSMNLGGIQDGDLIPFTKEVLIGANVDGAGNGYSDKWRGTLDDVRIYNRALSAREIATLTA